MKRWSWFWFFVCVAGGVALLDIYWLIFVQWTWFLFASFVFMGVTVSNSIRLYLKHNRRDST